jgi:hypothetical protein
MAGNQQAHSSHLRRLMRNLVKGSIVCGFGSSERSEVGRKTTTPDSLSPYSHLTADAK